MYQGHRVIAWTPYGRERTVSLLYRYLKREHARGLLDEWMLCMNTDPNQVEDVAYAEKLAADHAWINPYPIPGAGTPTDFNLPAGIPYSWRTGIRSPKQMNTGRFVVYMQDPEAIYVRFDDDIIWLHDAALVTLVDRKLRRPERLAIFPVIINNALSSWFLQRHCRIPCDPASGWGQVMAHAVDPIGWGDPHFAELLHRAALDAIREQRIDAWLVPIEHELGRRQQFSVSCFAISGREYADLKGILDWDEEEHWLTMHKPSLVNRSNIICGQALVSHYTFFTQREYLVTTDILDQYRDLDIPPTPTPPPLYAEGESLPVLHDDADLDAQGDAYYSDTHALGT